MSREPLATFVVVYSGAQCRNNMVCELLHLPEKLDIDQYFPEQHMNENDSGKEKWICSVPQNKVDAIEQAEAI
ncbi:MAG TPA: hypothetical protein VK604_03320 [Bryobacteraceae bacterium]|nr:hypothetical protein [Bryobacteraceae bacterium]HTF69494.1 hypothetical protein [Edaphobacter sp.]